MKILYGDNTSGLPSNSLKEKLRSDKKRLEDQTPKGNGTGS